MKTNLKLLFFIGIIFIFLTSCDAIKLNWGTPIAKTPLQPQDHNLDDSWRKEEEENTEEKKKKKKGEDETTETEVSKVATGEASYYSNALNGNPTASGEPYDKNALTAAHKELPFGTVVKVTNLKNGRTVTVTINDRLSRVSSRSIDLSMAAALEIDMINDGVVDVEIAVVN